MISNIVIVGGGAAGWLTAGLLAAEFGDLAASGVSITLIESPDIPTIGVGEGTWPTMRASLKKIGLSESEFIKTCSASFKQGSKFVAWRNGAADDFYYHPFMLPDGMHDANLYAGWQAFQPETEYSDTVSIQGRLCEQGCAPKLLTTPEYAGVMNYGYHLDAGRFGELLRRHCCEVLGVRHLQQNVLKVNFDERGHITSLLTDAEQNLEGDLFIDCSGTHALLLGEAMGVPFVSQKQYSINDAAIAVQVPYANADSPIACATVSTAQNSGWTWDIGLSSRRGVGYVYSSVHTTEEQVTEELLNYVRPGLSKEQVGALSFKKLSINAGHRQVFWQKNCVAVGMASGFIEPLEASALALVELSAKFIADELPLSQNTLPYVAEKFNKLFLYRWQRVIEFLKLHYAVSERRDTQYWRDATDPNSFSEVLKQNLALWQNRPPNFRDFIQSEEVFPSASYHYVLYGMGFKTQLEFNRGANDRVERALEIFNKSHQHFEKLKAVLPSNRKLLSDIHQHGLQKI